MPYQPQTQNAEAPKDWPGVARWTTAFRDWVLQELRKVADEFNAGRDGVTYKVLYAEPGRLYPAMVVYFDASAPSATSGEGLYRRNKANTAWVFVG